MLILSRREDESIIIGEGDDAMILTVVTIKGKQVRLGITASKDIPVHREEIYNKLHPDAHIEVKKTYKKEY
jgi:carbon storage regulator